jgi:hypothetical protein
MTTNCPDCNRDTVWIETSKPGLTLSAFTGPGLFGSCARSFALFTEKSVREGWQSSTPEFYSCSVGVKACDPRRGFETQTGRRSRSTINVWRQPNIDVGITKLNHTKTPANLLLLEKVPLRPYCAIILIIVITYRLRWLLLNTLWWS